MSSKDVAVDDATLQEKIQSLQKKIASGPVETRDKVVSQAAARPMKGTVLLAPAEEVKRHGN